MKTIERLRELEKAATPAPWGIDHDKRDGGVDQIVECRSGRTLTVAFGTSDGNEDDFPLIAATRNALPALLAVVEAQAAEIRAWRDLWDAMKKDHNGPHTQKLLKKLAAEEKTDAALRALEGGSHE